MPEHTDPAALAELYSLPVALERPTPCYRSVARWFSENIVKAPLESRAEEDAVQRRIRVHEWATGGARRLRKLDRDEAREVLEVTAYLLGFESTLRSTREGRVL